MSKLLRFLVIGLVTITALSCRASVPSMVPIGDIATIDVRGEVPDYIPIYPGSDNYIADPLTTDSDILTGTNLQKTVVGTLTTDANPASVFQWYKDTIAELGWILIDSQQYNGANAQIRAIREEETMDLSILSDAVTTKTHITYLVTKEASK
ncbi:MAG TPA: hypothetical protein PKV16_05025 [Caldisericia bacterium]|nr:hypothetical protein [Caldisericia bacterium]HPF48675.1 hypothetical protein [Caldisericia bacterium]HPI83665.1 hypothetical protein [Caldisericia bacterium]HPQ93130.1 hypothetical protein [Caldisericia bacterium]HRV75037.1 hypothetical protein [Caldisericia bacterium]